MCTCAPTRVRAVRTLHNRSNRKMAIGCGGRGWTWTVPRADPVTHLQLPDQRKARRLFLICRKAGRLASWNCLYACLSPPPPSSPDPPPSIKKNCSTRAQPVGPCPPVPACSLPAMPLLRACRGPTSSIPSSVARPHGTAPTSKIRHVPTHTRQPPQIPRPFPASDLFPYPSLTDTTRPSKKPTGRCLPTPTPARQLPPTSRSASQAPPPLITCWPGRGLPPRAQQPPRCRSARRRPRAEPAQRSRVGAG
jgi:hypothetical protein